MKETVIPHLGNDPSQDSRKGVLIMQIRSKIVFRFVRSEGFYIQIFAKRFFITC